MDEKEVRYFNLVIRYLSYRPRSEKEILDYLKKKLDRSSIDEEKREEVIASIMAKLVKYNYVNDIDFAKFWINQRINSKKKPLRVIEFELMQKGISKDLFQPILSNLSSDLELNNAKELAERKLNFLRKETPKKRKEKTIQFLLRKGFSFDVARKAVEFYKV